MGAAAELRQLVLGVDVRSRRRFLLPATGVELTGSREASFSGGTRVDWRAFVERERSAKANTSFAVNGGHFADNIGARRGNYKGLGARMTNARGLDPSRFRLFTDRRVEVAAADSMYGRGAIDLTASQGFGALAASVTVAGGSLLRGLPRQRFWYLGGNQTVRGQSPDTSQSGNAFWLTRIEVGKNDAALRPTVFGDVGWTGDRKKMGQIGRPLSGVGAGVSFLDGLFRFDVARGIYPRSQVRVDLYLESKF